LLHAEFSATDYTLNIVIQCRFFFVFKHFAGSEKVLENFSWGSWKILEKSWIFLSAKEWERCSEHRSQVAVKARLQVVQSIV